MDQRLKCKARNCKTLRGKHRQYNFWHTRQKDPLWLTSKCNGNKNNNEQWDLNKLSVIVVFILSAPWGIRMRCLWKFPDERDWLWLSKPLIQFSVDGCGCAPSLLFDLRPNYCGGNEENGDLFQKVSACTAALSSPHIAAGHYQPMPLPGTLGHSLACLGQSLGGGGTATFSWVLVHTRFYLCPPKVCFPNPVWVLVGLMETSSKRASATARSAAPRAPASAAGHCWLLPPQDILKYSRADLAQSLWGILVCTRFCLSFPRISGR